MLSDSRVQYVMFIPKKQSQVSGQVLILVQSLRSIAHSKERKKLPTVGGVRVTTAPTCQKLFAVLSPFSVDFVPFF